MKKFVNLFLRNILGNFGYLHFNCEIFSVTFNIQVVREGLTFRGSGLDHFFRTSPNFLYFHVTRVIFPNLVLLRWGNLNYLFSSESFFRSFLNPTAPGVVDVECHKTS